MNSKLKILIEEYNTNSKTPSNHGEEWKLIDTKERLFNQGKVTLVLNKCNEQEVVISIEKSGKLIFCTNGIIIDMDLYNKIVNDLLLKSFDEFINEYYELLSNNIKN